MIVVCDASPLIGLARIGKVGLLAQLFGKVVVPEAVWDEIYRASGPNHAIFPPDPEHR